MQFLTITQFTQQVKQLIEKRFYSVMLQGEISSITHHASGHIYITLKDQFSVVHAVIWSSFAKKLKINPQRGDQVELKGRLTLYPPHGKYQIVIEKMRQKGVGNLYQRFIQMKNRLQQEGLFDLPKKKIPFFPNRIGIITAKGGAALTDFINIAQRRHPNVDLLIFPTPVQGTEAAKKIADSINHADQHPDIDLIVLTRGGGSLEDLYPFNEEEVARAIAHCNTPLISAVGHERDITIADFVADQRAATPSEAAELVTPEIDRLYLDLGMNQAKMIHLIRNRFLNDLNTIEEMKRQLKQTSPAINIKTLNLQNKRNILIKQLKKIVFKNQESLFYQQKELISYHPKNKLQRNQKELMLLKIRLKQLIIDQLSTQNHQLSLLKQTIKNRSPLTILNQGYTLLLN